MCSRDEEEKEADQHVVVQVLDLVLLVLVLVLLVLGQPQWLPADLFDPSLFIQLSCADWPKLVVMASAERLSSSCQKCLISENCPSLPYRSTTLQGG